MLSSASFLNKPIEILVPSSKGYGELLYMKAGVTAYHMLYKLHQSMTLLILRKRIQRKCSSTKLAQRSET